MRRRRRVVGDAELPVRPVLREHAVEAGDEVILGRVVRRHHDREARGRRCAGRCAIAACARACSRGRSTRVDPVRVALLGPVRSQRGVGEPRGCWRATATSGRKATARPISATRLLEAPRLQFDDTQHVQRIEVPGCARERVVVEPTRRRSRRPPGGPSSARCSSASSGSACGGGTGRARRGSPCSAGRCRRDTGRCATAARARVSEIAPEPRFAREGAERLATGLVERGMLVDVARRTATSTIVAFEPPGQREPRERVVAVQPVGVERLGHERRGASPGSPRARSPSRGRRAVPRSRPCASSRRAAEHEVAGRHRGVVPHQYVQQRAARRRPRATRPRSSRAYGGSAGRSSSSIEADRRRTRARAPRPARPRGAPAACGA